MAAAKPLTVAEVKAADAARVAARLSDTTKGLTFVVGSRGGVWQWQGRVAGTPRKITGRRFEGGLGMTVAQARAWADDINANLAKGVDVYVAFGAGTAPVTDAPESVSKARPVLTCQEAWDLHIAEALSSGKNVEKTLTDKRQTWDRLFAEPIGNKALTEVTYLELADLVEPLRSVGKRAAFNNAVRYIKRFFTWAEEAEARTGLSDSPARRLKTGEPNTRDRYLNETEVRWLWDAVAELDATSRAFFLTLLLTGQRRDEVRSLVRSELDMDRRLMDIPDERMKGNVAHMTPCGDKAWSLISGRLTSHNYRFVFPSPRSYLTETAYSDYDLGNALKFLNAMMSGKANAAGLTYERWMPHDLRRTFSTLASGILSDDEDTVLDKDHIERVLAHKIGGVRGIYNKHEYLKEKRRVLRVWEDEVRRIVGDEAFNRYL